MASSPVRWNLVISNETDRALRTFLATEGRARKGELSRFVEEAVQRQIFASAAEAAKRKNTSRSAAEIDSAIEEALTWARQG